MDSGTQTLDAAAVLAAARAARQAENQAAAQLLFQAVEWARLHEVTDVDDAATWLVERGRDTGIPIAGPGAPLVSEFAVAELATALGLSAGSGRNLVGQALELAYRLPLLWARVRDGSLAPWRARRIAEETTVLSVEAAAYVDAQLAPFAHRTGPVQVQRLVETAIATFMPEVAAERRERAADGRHFDVHADQVSFAGTARIEAELDLADALDLDDAITAGAAELAELGCPDSLDVRRAAAAGILARRQLALNLTSTSPDHGTDTGTGSEARAVPAGSTSGRRVGRKRDMVLYVHLAEDAIRSHDPDAVAWVENAGGQLLTAGQVATWCGSSDTTRVVVKPVVDLHQPAGADGYRVPDWLAERIRLRDRTCVHPWCQRPARSCDLDHILAYDPDGPPGQTTMGNLACLCRLHHRMKTHGGWDYTMIQPGVYLWRSPHGHTWLRDSTGTTDLTPDPLDPPPRRTS